MLWENLVSGLALALIYLVNHALKSNYSKFHQEICDATSKDGSKVSLPKLLLLYAGGDMFTCSTNDRFCDATCKLLLHHR